VLSAHCHDDLVLRSLTRSPPSKRERDKWSARSTVSANGGNAALEEIVMAAERGHKSSRFSARSIRARSCVRAGCCRSRSASFPQPNKAIVGRNAFAHEAGIHQHGMLQNGLTYEIISPETVGAGGSSIVLGKALGRHALERRYRELG